MPYVFVSSADFVGPEMKGARADLRVKCAVRVRVAETSPDAQ